MNWKDIKVASDHLHFTHQGKPLFNKSFLEVLKFHSPGLAPVKDESGAYHINTKGEAIYSERYDRTFGYYCLRSAVKKEGVWFYITDQGKRISSANYAWVGNFQEDCCTVRDNDGNYFHLDKNGHPIYAEMYRYAGDFKDGYACVRNKENQCYHIDYSGKRIHEKSFLDLGVFHKNFATARDQKGWHHVDRKGKECYPERYLEVEPFYNGFALVTDFDYQKRVIDENGDEMIVI